MLSQGNQGEVLAVTWLMSQGYDVALPIGSCSNYDVIAVIENRPVLVQVKTTRQRIGERCGVTVCTRGGNQSWNRIVKRFGPERCDFLYVHAADGRRWFIPSDRVDGETAIIVGGPKYADFELEPGAPLTLS